MGTAATADWRITSWRGNYVQIDGKSEYADVSDTSHPGWADGLTVAWAWDHTGDGVVNLVDGYYALGNIDTTISGWTVQTHTGYVKSGDSIQVVIQRDSNTTAYGPTNYAKYTWGVDDAGSDLTSFSARLSQEGVASGAKAEVTYTLNFGTVTDDITTGDITLEATLVTP